MQGDNSIHFIADRSQIPKSKSVSEILSNYANHLPLLSLKLEIYKENNQKVREISDAILNTVDSNEISAFFGKKVLDKNENLYKKQSKKYKEQKSAVIEALKCKLSAIKTDFKNVRRLEIQTPISHKTPKM